MMITLRNDYHGSAVRVRIPADGILTPRQYRRACRALCPVTACKCGKIRGPQDVEIEPTADSVRILPRE